MHPLCRPLSLAVLTVVLLCTTATGPLTAQSTPSYGVNDLGALLIPMAMPEGGFPILAGSFQTPPSTASHGFIGAVGFFRALGTLGGANSVARATNGSLSAGESQTSSGAYHAFVADFRGQMTDIGTLGGPESRAYGVNDFDIVVGGSDVAAGGGLKQAFIYQNGVLSPLGATLGGSSTFAFDINNNGQVVGYADLPGTPGSSRAFLYANGSTVNLGSLGGRSVAYAINDAAVVVGDSAISGSSPLHAFRWEAGVMRDLGTLGGANSSAAAIGADGVIAGWAENAQGARHAVIWRDGVITDLNTLIPPGTDWELVAATGIGFRDAVIGWGRRGDGQLHGFMLTPPFDVELSLSNHQNEEATNFPNPHEAGPLLLGVSVFNHGGFAPTGLTIRDTLTGPIEYVSWTGGDCVVDRTVGHQTLTCTVTPFESFGRDIMIQTRSTGPGTITHAAAIISSGHLDSNPANDSATETNRAVSLSSLTLASTKVTGGTQVFTVVTLTSPIGVGDADVHLTSSNPAVATVPFPFDVVSFQNGGLFAETYVTTKPVSAPVTVTISASFGLRTITVPLTIMPAGSSWPFGDTPRPIPGIIQAEDFDEGGEGAGYHDTTGGNDGGQYRHTNVDIETSADAGGGYDVGWMAAGEWLGYAVTVQNAGTYRLVLRVAANGAGGRLHVEFNGVDKTGPMTIPNTGGWQAWRDISASVTLSAGMQRMRVVVDAAGATGVVGNLNYVALTAASAPQSTPFTGSPIAIPGIVQAENFDNGGEGVAYHDTSAGNSGGVYRTTDVDVQATTDSGGGYNVGWMAPGEWLAYSVNVTAAATYRLDLRVAASGAGGRVHVEFNRVDKTGPITIPNTNGWQSWSTLQTQVTLSGGAQTMRVVVDAAGPTGIVGNLNFVQITNLTTPAPSDIVIYAADVPGDRIHGSWSKQNDSTSPGGLKLQTTNAGVSHTDSPLASPVDYFDVSFEAVAGQPYALWLRLKALDNNKFNDAVWVQFSGSQANGGPIYRMGSTSALLVNLATDATASSLSNWGWQNGAYWLTQTTTFTFPAGGTQTIRVQVREDGVQVDQIVLSPNTYRNGSPGAVSNDTVIVAKPH
jgi:probable HAF family extracellular repeat protein